MMDDLSGEFPFRLFTPKLRYRLYQPDDTAARCGGFIPSGEVIRWRAWCEAPYLRHYNGVFSTSAVAADTNHADLQTSLVRLGRIELPRVSCSSLPFTKCRILPHLRSGLGGLNFICRKRHDSHKRALWWMRRGFEPRMVQAVCDELYSRPRWLLQPQ